MDTTSFPASSSSSLSSIFSNFFFQSQLNLVDVLFLRLSSLFGSPSSARTGDEFFGSEIGGTEPSASEAEYEKEASLETESEIR
jgi:hypothetical protein